MTNRESKSDASPTLPEDDNAAREFLRLLAQRVILRLRNRTSTTRNQHNGVSRVRGIDDCTDEGGMSGGNMP
jgi:hypothetical protein